MADPGLQAADPVPQTVPAGLLAGAAQQVTPSASPPPDAASRAQSRTLAINLGGPPQPSDLQGLDQAVQKIYKGESNGDYRARYGFPDLPGAAGPAGISHALGAAQWQPGTWKEAAREVEQKYGYAPDFNKPEDQDLVTKYWAKKRYGVLTGGRDLASDIKSGAVEWHALSPEWTSLGKGKDPTSGGTANTQWGQAVAEQSRAATADELKRIERDRSEYLNEASKAAPGSSERMAMLHEAHDAAKRATELYEKQMTSPPVYKPADMFAGFGGVLQALTLLAGRKSAQPLTATMNMTAAMMDGANSENKEDFERAYHIWDKQTQYALKLVDIQNQDFRNIMEDQRMADNEKQANLRTLFAAYEMDAAAGAAQRGDVAEQARVLQGMAQMQETAQFHRDEIKHWYDQTSRPQWQERYDPTKKDEAGNPTLYYFDPRTRQTVTQSGDPYTPGGTMKPGSMGQATGQMSPDAVRLAAKQYEMGDTGVITSLPRGGPARLQVENQVAEDLKGMDDAGQQIIMNRIRMAEAKAAATTAGRVTMQTDLYSQEARGAGRLLVDASKAYSRTDYPPINKALNAYETNTGDQNIIRFGTAINAVLNAYGKLSNPTGTGIHDADKERLEGQISTALSHGQIEAAVDQIIAEGINVSNAAKQAQAETLAGLKPNLPGATSVGGPTPGTTRMYQGKMLTFKGGDWRDKNNWVESPAGSEPRP